MKKLFLLAMTLVLTAALFAGCGCTNSNKDNTSTPTGMTETMPTIATTAPTTVPTTQATRPTMEETSDTGNGMLEDETTGASDSTEESGLSRRMMPGTAHSGR